MTLFLAAAVEAGNSAAEESFSNVLKKYYGGRRDEKTLQILKNQ
jgi:uncharacterized protein (DUF1810 family)